MSKNPRFIIEHLQIHPFFETTDNTMEIIKTEKSKYLDTPNIYQEILYTLHIETSK